MKRARATIRIDLAEAAIDPETIAAALAPDDTAEIATRVADDAIETRIERDSVGGLRSTIDDYVQNCRVATRVAASATGEAGATDEAITIQDAEDPEEPEKSEESKRQE